MLDRVAPPGTTKRGGWELSQAMISKVEAGMLTGRIKMDRDAPPR
jgi:hypothetical protein